jgi:type II secretion system protein D
MRDRRTAAGGDGGPRKPWIRRTLAVGLVGLLAATSGALGARPARAEEDIRTIELQPEMKVEDILYGLMKALDDKIPIVWQPDDKAITGKKLTGARSFTAPADKIFDVVRALLTFEEVVLIPIGPPRYVVYVAMDARTLASQYILKNKPLYVEITDENAKEYEVQDGLFIATTIKVKNMDSLRDASTALRRLTTANNIGSVQEVPAARAFVVSDFAPNVVAIYKLLREMDVQPQGKKVQTAYIELVNATAEDIEPILTDLFTGKQRLPVGGPNQPGGEIVDPEPRIIADMRTNQIILYATADDIAEITELVRHLDTRLVFPTQFVHVIRLKNLEAAATAQVLQSLIEGTTLFGQAAGGLGYTSGRSSSRSGMRNSNQPGAARQLPGQVTPAIATSPEFEEKPTVVADEASNSLIIASSKGQFDQLKLVIDEIDVMKSQVLIEAALVELSLDDSYKFAVEIAGLDDNGLAPHGGASAFGGTNFGLTEFADRDGDGTFTDRIPPFITAGGAAPTGVIGGIFAAGQVPLIYRALNTVKKTHILQLPSIVTSDNQEATIKVLDEQATTDNTTSSGGNVSGGFQGFQDAGTTLSISPHIASDNYLLLNIDLEVSGFLGEPKTIGAIQIPANKFNRQVQTTVTLPDRHTVVLGGLIGTTQRSTVDQVPLLGEIPILGNLFKGTDKADIRTNLFLFVTPTILSKTDTEFKKFDEITCLRKRKADELVGAVDIPFSNFVGCEDRRCLVDPATGCVRGSGSTSDRLDRLGVFDATQFRGVDKARLAAEAQARRRAMMEGTTPVSTGGKTGR